MPASQVIPARRCPECGQPFTPLPRLTDGTLPEACRRCIRRFNGKQRRGLQPEAFKIAVADRTRLARERVAQQLRREFGDISDRDAAIFSFGVGVGYTRGYNAGYRLTVKAVRE